MSLQIVLVAKARMVRECMRTILDGKRDLRVVAELPDLETLEPWLQDHAADVALVDVTGAPPAAALDIVRRLADRHPGVRIVISGTTLERHWLVSGAAAALPKEAGAEALVEAICTKAGSAAALDAEPDIGGWSSLTVRQREVLRLASEGLSAREIGITLGIGSRTVETHRAAAMRRLGARTFHEVLLRMAWTDERLDPLEAHPEPGGDPESGSSPSDAEDGGGAALPPSGTGPGVKATAV